MACAKVLTPDETVDTSDGVSLGAAGLADLVPLVALDRLCFRADAWPAGAWRDAVAEPGWVTVVLRRSGTIVAASALLVGGGPASLASLAVHPDHRRRGFGRRLLRDAIARAQAAGAGWLTLEVDLANLHARRLYRGEGFGVLRRFREDGRWRLEMVRRLEAGRGR